MHAGLVHTRASNTQHTITLVTRHKLQMGTTRPSVWKTGKQILTAVPSRDTNLAVQATWCKALLSLAFQMPSLPLSTISARQSKERTATITQLAHRTDVPVPVPTVIMTAGLAMARPLPARADSAQR